MFYITLTKHNDAFHSLISIIIILRLIPGMVLNTASLLPWMWFTLKYASKNYSQEMGVLLISELWIIALAN